MLIYTAGPYSADTDEGITANIEAARKVAIELWEAGHVALCPHLNTAHFERDCKTTYRQYIEGDLNMLSRCDAILMLPGWESSQGARQEAAYAQELEMPVYLYPTIPPLHPTEVRCPEQSRAFRETVCQMYRTHLSKNADYCLAPGTKVLTGDLQWIPIECVTQGMTLLGFDECVQHPMQFRRMYRPSVVERVATVRLPAYRITLENGDEFVASGQHPWLVAQGVTSTWVTTEHLHPKEIRVQHSKLIKVLDVWETKTDYDSGYLAAALDGEGWLSQQTPTGKNRHKHGKGFVLGFAQRDNAMLAKVREILDGRDIQYRLKGYRKNLVQLIFSKPRRDAIRLLGESRPQRLLANLDLNLGMVDLRNRVPMVRLEFIGEQELVSLQTSTRTFIANGYATHNSPANILGPGWLGLVTRLWDKTARLMNLTGFRFEIQQAGEFVAPNVPKHESIDDTLMDAAVYAVIGRLLRMGKWGR